MDELGAVRPWSMPLAGFLAASVLIAVLLLVLITTPTTSPDHAGGVVAPLMVVRPLSVIDASEAAAPVEKTVASAATHPPMDEPTTMTFDGRPLRKVRTLDMVVTAYSPDEKSCGIFTDGQTASGYSVWTNGMKLAAADTRLLPFGTIITVPGYHQHRPIQVLDRGAKIKGRRLDVLMPMHEMAVAFGRQKLTVTVWEYADRSADE